MVICSENFGATWSFFSCERKLCNSGVCFFNELELHLSLKIYIMVSLPCSVR